jgi:GNAT superfamily N-acetyltransferase
MIAGATPDHLALIGDVLAYGGRSGSWDPSLGNGGANLDALLAKLEYAFIHGVLPQIDPRTGAHIETRIAGYVFHAGPGTPPIGFGLFKDFTAAGYELWMLGIAEPYRGKGTAAPCFLSSLGRRLEAASCWRAVRGLPRARVVARTFCTRTGLRRAVQPGTRSGCCTAGRRRPLCR